MRYLANFVLPTVNEGLFTEVKYAEEAEPEARKLVEMYNKEGRDAGFGPPPGPKRQRSDGRGGGSYRDRNDRNYRPPRDNRYYGSKHNAHSLLIIIFFQYLLVFSS